MTDMHFTRTGNGIKFNVQTVELRFVRLVAPVIACRETIFASKQSRPFVFEIFTQSGLVGRLESQVLRRLLVVYITRYGLFD